MFLGIDVGTSAVKAVLVDSDERLVDQATAPLEVTRPRPTWSEQDPEQWWAATDRVLGALRERAPTGMSGVRGIGLSGQMHGATLLDASDAVLRPCILWNDGRSEAECRVLETRFPRSREITGNLAMPGFTAPKLVWVAAHEPDVFRRTARVLLPKDWVRLRLTGEAVSDLSDASGTLWLDVGARDWSDAMLAACEMSRAWMPRLVEGSEPSGTLLPKWAARFGLGERVVVAGGAGDQAAGAAGAGVVRPGDAFLSLGTSGVYFAASERFAPNPDDAVHAFCHCFPRAWHQMSVILSAGACLAWVTRLVGGRDEASLVAEVEKADRPTRGLVFLPYLSGERTPHNDPHSRGVFFGLTHDHDRLDLARAVLEGVAFALAEGQAALVAGGTEVRRVQVIGGGARSPFWGRILAAALERELDYTAGADVGPALGAARLARLAVDGGAPADVCAPGAVVSTLAPDAALAARYAGDRARFAELYRTLAPAFRTGAGNA